ncbi:unnamed protein product [Ostreobium quekettii]|uniref:Oxysterol-binding protein n=1 Tax=Ostreobium quekettii TaxID=121088 RepID=A0A8S1J6G1_9CHLO|nr:unnamed protein product [Ostreobium quekettii]|eukprot:evm.model.scf_1239.1 EVM.evm.TU.scf_1239.1   scf_1239:9736-11112(-)
MAERNAGEDSSLIGSFVSWGSDWLGYAQNQINSFIGFDQLEVVNPESEGAERGASAGNSDDERQQLWSSFQQYVGMDITSLVTVPVWIMEPFSVLQRMAEIMEYTEILDRANACEDRLQRLALVAAFGVTPYGSSERPWKPFNPILGETFQLQCGNGVRFLSEQVSHHPPIGAAHAENRNFVYDIIAAPKSKFLGNSVEIYPQGRTRIRLKRTGEVFSLVPPTSKACNVVVGGIWIDSFGTLTVVNVSTGDKAALEFTPCGWFGAGRYEYEGHVTDGSTGAKALRVFGKWNSHCSVERLEDGSAESSGQAERLWTCAEKPADDVYSRTHFCLKCNTCSGAAEPLASDSRRRSDIAFLNKGDSTAAGTWKYDLEEMQRAERREREKRGDTWEPRWFRRVSSGDPELTVHPWEYSLKEVPHWEWTGDFDNWGGPARVSNEDSVLGQGFSPWQYPELHGKA